MNDDIEPVGCTVVREMEKAYLLNDGELEAWFPKSEIAFERRNIKTGNAVALIPMWLLKAKGWDQ